VVLPSVEPEEIGNVCAIFAEVLPNPLLQTEGSA
jgi:hypothetical protein